MEERPAASTPQIQMRMQRQRRRDTAPEVTLRRALHRRGLRFRVDRSPITGMRRRADIVFGSTRVAVFVDGCFWHGCPLHGTYPTKNAAWWHAKLAANRTRDRDTDARLREAGWTVLRVWEHEEPDMAAAGVAAVVLDRRSRHSREPTRNLGVAPEHTRG